MMASIQDVPQSSNRSELGTSAPIPRTKEAYTSRDGLWRCCSSELHSGACERPLWSAVGVDGSIATLLYKEEQHDKTSVTYGSFVSTTIR